MYLCLQGFGDDDILSGGAGGDSYMFTGEFGNDKIFDFGQSNWDSDSSQYTNYDSLLIEAGVSDLWFERSAGRGDHLTITDSSGRNSIYVARQFNPYTDMTAIEEVQFGFGTDTTVSYGLANGYGYSSSNNDNTIQVLKDGEEWVFLDGDDDSRIYLNSNEGAASLKITENESFGSDQYVDIELIYADNSDDGIEVELSSAKRGAEITLVSKNDIDTSTLVNDYGLTVNASNNSYAIYNDSSELLFTLVIDDNVNYGA